MHARLSGGKWVAAISWAVMRFGTVIFDCDSTLCALEGIDELAGERRQAVAELTDRAMRGETPLEEVYGSRLELIRPRRSDVESLAARYIAALIPDAAATISALRSEGIEVRILTAGLLPAIRLLAEHLGVPARSVAAVDVQFSSAGEYERFDDRSPLARSGGKSTVVKQWLPRLPRPIMMVGDGVTDLEVKPLVDLFVAFAGVVERPAVVSTATHVIRAKSLAPVFALALGQDAPRDPNNLALMERGRALLDADKPTSSK